MRRPPPLPVSVLEGSVGGRNGVAETDVRQPLRQLASELGASPQSLRDPARQVDVDARPR